MKKLIFACVNDDAQSFQNVPYNSNIIAKTPTTVFFKTTPYYKQKNISLNTIKIDDDITISTVFYEVILIFVRRRLIHPIYMYVK